MIGYGYTEHNLGRILPYHVLIKIISYVFGIRNCNSGGLFFWRCFGILEKPATQIHTLVADGYLVTDYKFAHTIFVFVTETAMFYGRAHVRPVR
jgi:hypothetical protein